MEITYLIVGLLLGALLAALLVYNRFMSGGAYIAASTLADKYVLKDILIDIQQQLDSVKKELNDKMLIIIELNKDLGSQEQISAHLEEKLNGQKEEINTLQKRFQTEFENIANRLLAIGSSALKNCSYATNDTLLSITKCLLSGNCTIKSGRLTCPLWSLKDVCT